MPCERTGGKGYKLKYRNFYLNIIIYLLNHCNSDEALEPAAQKGCGVFNIGDDFQESLPTSAILQFCEITSYYYKKSPKHMQMV